MQIVDCTVFYTDEEKAAFKEEFDIRNKMEDLFNNTEKKDE